MKKTACILGIISIAISLFLCIFVRTSDFQVIDSSYVEEDGNLLFIEDGRNLFRLDTEGEVLLWKRLPKKKGTNSFVYGNVSSDSNGNIYLLTTESSEKDNFMEQRVEQYSADGKKKKDIFTCNAEESHTQIFTAQCIGNILAIITMTDANSLQLSVYDISTGKMTTKEFQFEVFPNFDWIKYTADGSLYYTDHNNGLYCLYNAAGEEYNKKIEGNLHGILHMIPSVLSSDSTGNVYFNDFCTPRFLKYSRGSGALTQVYGEKDEVADGILYSTLINVRTFNGKLLGQANESFYEAPFFLIKDSRETHIVSQKRFSEKWCIHFFLLCTFFLFFCLMVLFLAVRAVIRNKSILVKQVFIMTPLLLINSVILVSAMRYYLIASMTNETYFQLYTLSKNFAQRLSPENMKKIEIPLETDNPYYQELEQAVTIDVNEFYEAFPQAIPKYLYYNVYLFRNEKKYLLLSNDVSQEGHFNGVIEYYSDSNSVIKKKIEGKNMQLMLEKAENGDSMFCLYDVKDAEGVTVGKVEVGLLFNEYLKELEYVVHRFLMIITVVMLGIIVVLIGIVVVTLRSLKKLKKGVNDIAEGNWNTVVDIHSGDEIEEIGNAFHKMVRKVRSYLDSIEQLNSAYEKFIPHETFAFLGKSSILEVRLGEHVNRDMRVLTIATKNFYQICEKMSATEQFVFLNQLYSLLAKAITRVGGVIEDYRDAGVRAVFDASADVCIDCMLEIAEGLPLISKSVCLHAVIQRGDVMFGITGNSQRAEAIAVSEILNYTYRLQQLAEENGIYVLITADACQTLKNPEKYKCRYIGRVKGQRETHLFIDLFDVIDAYPLREQKKRILTLEEFQKGVKKYILGELDEARRHFINVIRIDKEDKMAQSYIFLCDNYREKLPDTWEGYYR